MSQKKAKRERQAIRARLRPGLPKLPVAMEKLDIDSRGYPIPWFVYRDPETGEPDFRVVAPGKIQDAVDKLLCWVSGRPFASKYCAFLGGPLSLITNTYGEPPSMVTVAHFAAQACPFLAIPSAKRREANIAAPVKDKHPAHVDENPGVIAMLVCRGYSTFTSEGATLFDATGWDDIIWYHEGKALGLEETKVPDGVVAKAIDRAEELLRPKVEAEVTNPEEEMKVFESRLKAVRRHAGLLPRRESSGTVGPTSAAVVAAALTIGLGASMAGRRR